MAALADSFEAHKFVTKLYVERSKFRAAITFYQETFGTVAVEAVEPSRKRKSMQVNTRIQATQMKIGESMILVSPSKSVVSEELVKRAVAKKSRSAVVVYTDDVLKCVEKGFFAGCIEASISDNPGQPGERMSRMIDPFGHEWLIQRIDPNLA